MTRNNKSTLRYIEQLNKYHTVVVYGKSYCKNSLKTIAMFKKNYPKLEKTNNLKVLDLNLELDGTSTERELVRLTKQSKTPMVFVHGTFMGGYDEVQAALESGALEERLSAHPSQQPQATEEGQKTLSITINVRGTAKAIVKEEEDEAAEKKAGAVPAIVDVADEKKDDDEATQASTTQHSTTSHHHHNALMHKLIVHENNQHSVVVWYKSSDPKSLAARTLLESAEDLEDVDISYHDMDAMPDHQLLEEELKHMTGQSSVPAVFVDGLHLGGNAELEAAFESGDLKELLMAGKPL